jgi:hypothetical protein
MFNWLAKQFSREDDDPDSLGSEKGLQAFIDALPTTLPPRTVEAIAEPFENARGLSLPAGKLRRALKRLDERAQGPLAEVWSTLFEDYHGRQITDNAWLVLMRFYRAVHAGYRVSLEAISSRPSIEDTERSEALLLGCRAMAALGRHKLLLRLRYRDVETGYWENVHGLYAWAAQLGGTNTLFELHPGSGFQSSIEREYLTTLMFDAAPVPNMLPTQMVALDCVLRRMAGNFEFSDAYRDTTPFVIDPARHQAPQRWLKGLPMRPGLRFFGAATAFAQIAGLRKQAATSATLPEWLSDARLDLELYRGLLDLLCAHWSTEPPQRAHRRDRQSGEILVTHGVSQVRRMVAATEYVKSGGQLSYQENTPYDHKMFDTIRFGVAGNAQVKAATAGQVLAPLDVLQKFELEGDRQMTERWSIADLSEAGIGAIAGAHAGWARVGMVVGLRHHESLDWQLAIIRRLSRSAQSKLSVGMQWIEGTTWCGRLKFGDDSNSNNPWVAVAGSSEAFHDAVLLRSKDGALSVLIEPGIFLEAGECMLSYEKRWHKVSLVRTIEAGFDFERIEVNMAVKQ